MHMYEVEAKDTWEFKITKARYSSQVSYRSLYPSHVCGGHDWVYLTLFPQETEIDNIHQLVVGATENIKEGNEDIREVGTWGSQI